VPAVEGRALIACTYASRKFPGRAPEGNELVRAYVGGALRPGVLELDDRTLLATVERELAELVGIRATPAAHPRAPLAARHAAVRGWAPGARRGDRSARRGAARRRARRRRLPGRRHPGLRQERRDRRRRPHGGEMMTPGSCFCGAVRFEVDLPVHSAAYCHCSMCRRMHGAGYVAWLAVPYPQLRIVAGEDRLTRFRSSEHGTRRVLRHVR